MDLDSVDRGILHLLQTNARHLTPVDMAKNVPVSENTVRNRIERLEEEGVIENYVPNINYDAAGYSLKVAFSCTAPMSRQSELAEEALHIDGVINVQEMIASRGNLRVTGVSSTLDEVLELAKDLSALELELETQELMRRERVRPFSHFGADEFGD